MAVYKEELFIMRYKPFFISFLVLCGLFAVALPDIHAREITDMYKRNVTVPDSITRVYTISPSVMLLLYSLIPTS